MSLLTFPLTGPNFMDRFGVRGYQYILDEALELSELGNGEILTSDYGPRLWRGKFELAKLTLNAAEAIKARIEALQFSGRTFHCYDPVIQTPASDPGGTTVSGYSSKILLINADNRRIKLKGLPSGYELQAGDRLSFVQASSGLTALHRVVDDSVVASSSFETGYFEVVPHILPGAAVDDIVTLLRPYCNAMIVPGSFKPGRIEGLYVRGMQFDFVQKVN